MKSNSRYSQPVNNNTAKIGNIVAFDNKRGLVIKVLNNTVVVDLTIMREYNFHLMGHERQVIHHTQYTVIPDE